MSEENLVFTGRSTIVDGEEHRVMALVDSDYVDKPDAEALVGGDAVPHSFPNGSRVIVIDDRYILRDAPENDTSEFGKPKDEENRGEVTDAFSDAQNNVVIGFFTDAHRMRYIPSTALALDTPA